MPASVYSLLFKDPELKKLDSSNMEIRTFTTDTVNIVGSCKFYLVYPDTKKLQEVTFFVAKNDGSVLLSCTTTLAFGNQEQEWTSTTKCKFNHKFSGSPTENKMSSRCSQLNNR